MKTSDSAYNFDVCILALSDLRTDARSYNIAMALVHSGKRVCVLAPDWSDKQLFDGLTMFYVPCPTIGRLWRKWFSFNAAVKRISETVSARSYWASDLWSLKSASLLARRHRATVLYDSREIYSALGPLHERPITQVIVASMERYYARFAQRIIVSGELDAEYVRQHLHRREKPVVVMNVPPYSDPQFGDKLRVHFNIDAHHPLVVYQGAVLEGRGIEPMILALQLLPSFHFCVIGDGPSLSAMMDMATKSGIHDRVHFLGSVANHELLSWTASADIGLCFVEPISFSYKLALPNKLFEYAMARIPALVSDLPAMRRIIEQYPFGELISTNANAEQIAATLQLLYSEKMRYTVYADAAARVFNREAQQQIIASLYDEIIST